MSKTTTPQQYEKLADLMATKEDIAQGHSKRPKEEVQAFWESVATTLNALGPPSKDSNLWRKVWIDWKSYAKRKLTNNRKEMVSTGGGQCALQRISPLEEKVIALTGLTTCTSGIRGSHDFGHNADEMDISACSVDPDDVPSTSRASNRRRTETSNASSLVREQIELQTEFYAEVRTHNENVMDRMEAMETHMRRMSRSLEQMANTAAKQLEEEQRHNRFKEKMMRLKMSQLQENYNPDEQ